MITYRLYLIIWWEDKMGQESKGKLAFFLSSLKDIFPFFFSMGRKSKKTKIFFMVSLLPVVIALIIKMNQFFSDRTAIKGIYIFDNMTIAIYLQFLILILALFYGTSVCSEEVEGKTLTYLTTRPVSKSALIVGKYAAYTSLIIIMTSSGVILSFFILNLNDLLDFSLYKILLRDVVVLSLGLMCYAAFFTFIGTIMKKSILFGLIFSFGWENVIQYFPGSTQRFAIVHYLKSLLPVPRTGRFSFLMFRLEPSSPLFAVFMIFLIIGVFLGLACILFSWKEYIFED
jgi:ABC-2 type transport system permease protein